MLAHYYRGEMSRMISWRDRLDRTTNWAIGALAAMLSISLASEQAHHSVLLFAMLLIHVLLFIEARRYRFFHVYRARVRLLEREYFAPLFAPEPGGTRTEPRRSRRRTCGCRDSLSRCCRRCRGACGETTAGFSSWCCWHGW